MRKNNRKNYETREISIDVDFCKNADGSCLINYGDTKVICTASIDEDIPKWLKIKKTGWVTAEYSMLPGSTNSRNKRESKIGKQSGRTVEIQRLIGRSLRSVLDLKVLDGYQIIIDCDVLQADGGTRTASITGGFVALSLAVNKLIKNGNILKNPILDYVAAISCGIIGDEIFVDLDYMEDSRADVDANFVVSKNSGFSEIQISGEENTFSIELTQKMIQQSVNVLKEIFEIQKNAINS
ncbi:MAG: ribonuclease PH [Pelagibacteraceae bacterium TMED65]|nr:ribonuclease PH [Rickettsiales bacterium]OUU51502.1 MAG: ribonuclease PH [Pelagibacteraceae bacterium TMED65]